VTVGATAVCNISKDSVEEELRETVERYVASSVNADIVLNETLELTEVHSSRKDILTLEEATPQIAAAFTYQIEAVQIWVDGKPVALLKSQAEAEALLRNISEEQSGDASLEFEQDVSFVKKYSPPEAIDLFETAKATLTAASSGNVIYDVKSGDTLSEIALSANMTLGELLALNDGLDPSEPIKVGQPILVKKDSPLLTVKYPEAQSAMKTIGDD
jgi:LysM repeat protein